MCLGKLKQVLNFHYVQRQFITFFRWWFTFEKEEPNKYQDVPNNYIQFNGV